MKKSICVIISLLIIMSIQIICFHSTQAAVVEKDGQFITMISEPNKNDGKSGEISGHKLYYNMPTKNMDNSSSLIVAEDTAYIYTNEFSSYLYTNEKCVKLISNREDVEAFKVDIETKLIGEEGGGEVNLSFLNSLTNDELNKVDIIAYAEMHNGTYGNFTVLDKIVQEDTIICNTKSINAMSRYNYSEDGFKIMTFGGTIPTVKYYVIPKSTITDKTLQIEFNDTIITDYSQSNLFCEISWNDINTILFMQGDVNGDRKLTSKDALYVLNYSVGTYNIADDRLSLSDYNKDGCINSIDALLILKKSVGLLL